MEIIEVLKQFNQSLKSDMSMMKKMVAHEKEAMSMCKQMKASTDNADMKKMCDSMTSQHEKMIGQMNDMMGSMKE